MTEPPFREKTVLSDSRVQQGIVCAADMIRNSKRGVILTGAGISTASGIPDFRSENSGLWQKYDPYEVASLSAFRYHPEKFFNFIRSFAQDIVLAQPNPGHIGLARLQQAGYLQTVVTQNVDGLHQRAGAQNVLEMHGSFGTLTCIDCYRQVSSVGHLEPFLEHGWLPRCPHCSGILKPDTVLFGEQLPKKIWLKAQEACKRCDLLIVIGSSLEVMPVAGLPLRALENGAHLIVINRTETYIDLRADIVFHEDLVEIISLMVDAVYDEQ